ncbi:MAG: GNAT family N-acetyltransferase [Leptolyngbya sp. IPPAS B-1204]|nr:N-acetyltransferase [Elainella sp. C42_A2020_010]RNJ65790.1 MAG: N-acetyltransferase [Leptolyngbya sp. IPPAS B-1204]
MDIRAERAEDISAVHKVNMAAFERENEADLVDRLRSVASTVSFVAVEFEQIVGHIFYSPVEIEGECADNLFILGLAPLAVLPEHQRQGIGASLIRHSVEECARLGCKAVVVLGHPEYYPKFGFVPAKEKGLRCEYAVPDEAFMVLELARGALKGCSGIVKYRSEFREFE